MTEVELHRIIHELKTGAPGYDEISAPLLKHVSAAIIEPLVYLCNMSLDQGIFPKELKLANVMPLHKAEDPALFNNYKPVITVHFIQDIRESYVLPTDWISWTPQSVD